MINFSPNTFIGVLALLAVGGMAAEILTNKNTAHNVTAVSNGYANVEKAALHP